MKFALKSFGVVFSTRDRGARMLEAVEPHLARGEHLVIDFADVMSVSYSFADEFVGELLERAAAGMYPREPALEHVDAAVYRTIAKSLHNRGLDRADVSSDLVSP